jgi:hypothetical protein
MTNLLKKSLLNAGHNCDKAHSKIHIYPFFTGRLEQGGFYGFVGACTSWMENCLWFLIFNGLFSARRCTRNQ